MKEKNDNDLVCYPDYLQVLAVSLTRGSVFPCPGATSCVSDSRQHRDHLDQGQEWDRIVGTDNCGGWHYCQFPQLRERKELREEKIVGEEKKIIPGQNAIFLEDMHDFYHLRDLHYFVFFFIDLTDLYSS